MTRPARWIERLLGYRPVGWRWRLYRTSDEQRQRSALPEWIALPAGIARRRRGASRVARAEILSHAGAFVRAHPRHAAAGPLALFLRKAPIAERVEAALREERFGEAERALREILSLDGEDAHAHLLLGVCRLRRGDLAGADPCFERAERELGRNPEVHAARGRYREASGEPERAKEAYRAALALDPGHGGALERMAALGEMVEIYLGTLEEPQQAFLPIGVYEETIRRQWDAEPRSVRFYLDRSHEHLRLGQTRLALDAAERALDGIERKSAQAGGGDAASLRVEARAARCRALLARERLGEARAAAEELRASAPESDWTASCLGHVLWFTGEREEAARWIERAIERNPDRMEDLLLFLRPEFPRAQKDPLVILKKLESRFPESFAIKAVMASILFASGHWDEGSDAAVEAARRGAGEDLLVDLTGRLGREGRDADVLRVAAAAGGWQRFLAGQALLRVNLATACERCGEEEAARSLWASLRDDAQAHPQLRLRARRALGGD